GALPAGHGEAARARGRAGRPRRLAQRRADPRPFDGPGDDVAGAAGLTTRRGQGTVMDPELDKAVLARLPRGRLDVLGGLRGEPGITVAVRGDRAWVAWDPSRTNVARELLSVEHVEFFRVSDGRYHRLGSWLPSTDVPRDLETTAVPLARALVPEPAHLSTP